MKNSNEVGSLRRSRTSSCSPNPSTSTTHMHFVTYTISIILLYTPHTNLYLSQLAKSSPGILFLLVKRSHRPQQLQRPTPTAATILNYHPSLLRGTHTPARGQCQFTPRGPHVSGRPGRDPVTRRVTLPRRFRTDRYRGRFKTSQPRNATWTAAREPAGERTARPGWLPVYLAWLCVC